MANPEPQPARPSALARLGRGLVREVVLPILVALGLVAIAVALIEGPPAGDFLYAVF
ncbi:MAG TPA: hypothetical protein VJP77_00130 [Planctomycetota bacterium]|nr:hypothetical protein [Planctomycetota bacterium]